MKIPLHPAQSAFRHSPALYRGFVGGRGAGKSWIGAYDLLRRAKPGCLYLIAAPTYPMLQDSSIRSFESIARQLNFLRDVRLSSGTARAVLGNGAEVLFRSADDPNRLRGPNLSGAWLDEAGDMDEDAYNRYVDQVISRSDVDSGIRPAYGEQLLTLSTCEYSSANGRYVVVARRVSD